MNGIGLPLLGGAGEQTLERAGRLHVGDQIGAAVVEHHLGQHRRRHAPAIGQVDKLRVRAKVGERVEQRQPVASLVARIAQVFDPRHRCVDAREAVGPFAHQIVADRGADPMGIGTPRVVDRHPRQKLVSQTSGGKAAGRQIEHDDLLGLHGVAATRPDPRIALVQLTVLSGSVSHDGIVANHFPRHMRFLGKCYRDAVAKDATLSGEVVATVVVNADRRSPSVESVSGPDVPVRCIEMAYRRTRADHDQDTSFEIRLRFSS